MLLCVLLCLYLCITCATYRYTHYDQPCLHPRALSEIVLKTYGFAFLLVLAPEYLLVYAAVSAWLSLIRRWALGPIR